MREEEKVAQQAVPLQVPLVPRQALALLSLIQREEEKAAQRAVPLQVPLVPRRALALLSLIQREVRSRLDHQEWCLNQHQTVFEL